MGLEISEAEINRMLRQSAQAPRPQAIDPVTPFLLQNLVQSAESFATNLALCVLCKDNEEYKKAVFRMCFSVLRPLAPQLVTLEVARGIFFGLYFQQSPEGVFDFAKADIPVSYTVSVLKFKAAFEKLSRDLYEHFVTKKLASYLTFGIIIEEFANSLRETIPETL